MIYVTADKMAKVDARAVEWGLSVERLMENAGRAVARFIKRRNPARVAVLYGKGNNGGGGLTAARHLAISGVEVGLVPADDYLNEHPRRQLHILHRMGMEPREYIGNVDYVLDALLGYGLEGDPKGRYASLIRKANSLNDTGTRIVSLDLPSGMHPDRGKRFEPCIDADYTLTLALPKKGLQRGDAGETHLVNTGIPCQLYEELGMDVETPFRDGDVVRL